MTNNAISQKPLCVMVDRHTHLEGSLDQSWIQQRALEDGFIIPKELKSLWNHKALPFSDFITAFNFSCRLLNSVDAVYEAVRAAVHRLPPSLNNVPRGIDMWVSPYFLVKEEQLLTLDELWQGLDKGIAEAQKDGVYIAVVIDAVNHFGIEQGHKLLDLVLKDKPSWVVGFSTGGLERIPFKEWYPVFYRARNAGLHTAAHAGEHGMADNVRQAIIDAEVERIVHGIQAAAYPNIMELLAERKIPVDICVTSNLSLVPNIRNHPLPTLLRAGVRCALGTDDPGVIPCNMLKEWDLAKGMGLTNEELILINNNSNADAWCFEKKMC